MVAYTKEEAIREILSSGTGLMEYVDFPRTGKTLQTRLPIQVSTLPVSLKDAVQCPGLGEHSASLLQQAGYSDAEVEELLQDKVIKVCAE